MRLLFGFIIALLVTQPGCSSYRLTEEEVNRGNIPSDHKVRIVLIDSSIVESGSYKHLVVQEPADLVTGSGTERRSGKPFAGVISRSEIDSARVVELTGPKKTSAAYVCWLKNGTSVGFTEYDYLDITPEHAPGLWCAGSRAGRGPSRPFKGRIDSAEIAMIEAEDYFLFHPAFPGQGKHWANFGIGGGRGSAAALLSYSYLTGNILGGVRMIGTFPLPVAENRQNITLFEIGGLVGLGFKSRFLEASVSGGISYVNGSDGRGPHRTFSGVSFSRDLEIGLTPFELFGFGLKLFSTSNSQMEWKGFFLFIQFGRIGSR